MVNRDNPETAGPQAVVDLLQEEWAAIAALGRALEPAEWDLPSECPGWSVRDVLAHMVGTERSLLGDPSPPPVDDPPGHVRNPMGAANEAWVRARRATPGPGLVAEFEDVTRRRLAELRSWPAERFERSGPSPVGEVPYHEFMRVRVMDCWIHEQDMRVATERPGHDTGPVAALALSRLRSALPFVVAKQAGAPDGATVRFEVHGEDSPRLDVTVRGGRGAFAAEAVDEPTVVLRMDDEAFWRLACGRVPGAAARSAGLVVVVGDEELGQRVVDAMAFMI